MDNKADKSTLTEENSSRTTGRFDYLVSSGLISEKQLNSILLREISEGVEIENIFIKEMRLKREDIGKSLELYYGIPYRGYREGESLLDDVFSGLNKNYLIKNNWIPLRKEKDELTILIADPSDSNQQQICDLFNKNIGIYEKIKFQVGLRVDIHDFINSVSSSSSDQSNVVHSEGPMKALISELELEQKEKSAPNVEKPPATPNIEQPSETNSAIVRLVNKILVEAYQENVSDIHVEPGKNEEPMSIRYRKDGACKVVQTIPALYKHAILSRLKIMSKLNIAEKRLPQDGKIILDFRKKKIGFRVAICPTVGGNEDAVIRILTDGKPLPLTKMRLSKRDLKLVKESTQKPYGLILAVGPTGSGKSTTLHSFLGHINSPEKKIWTAEDPVEITQDGLRQLQTNDKIGLTFPVAMRTFLRGDPDVIMVGEMRDNETCAIGLEAALTGHLVFSTLHTNSAPETITRLIDMGMEPLHFSDSLLLIVAQRLAHTLCIKCKKEYHPDKEEYELLAMEYGEDKFQELGIKYTDSLILKRAAGCDYCEYTGYAGRIGLFEILQGTKEMKRLIINSGAPEQIRTQAISDGMTTLKQDGIRKIFDGSCDLKKVNAVCIL
jgi:type II secretory ATPase GspE/PulE/Tfp pilus assembly ATPase PilB-like protein